MRCGCRGRQDLGARLTTMSRGASGGRTGRASLPAAPVLLVSDDAVVLEKGGAYRYDIFYSYYSGGKARGDVPISSLQPPPPLCYSVLDRLCYSVLDWHHAHVETAPGLLLRRADRRRGPPPRRTRWADGLQLAEPPGVRRGGRRCCGALPSLHPTSSSGRHAGPGADSPGRRCWWR